MEVIVDDDVFKNQVHCINNYFSHNEKLRIKEILKSYMNNHQKSVKFGSGKENVQDFMTYHRSRFKKKKITVTEGDTRKSFVPDSNES